FKDTQLEAWIDVSSGEPLRISVDERVSPTVDAQITTGEQLHTKLEVDFTKINQPLTVQAPTQTITVDRAVQQLLNNAQPN
ncbi:MAG: hypothetical protein WA001_03975, partial [Patescibacteria group bacterium]